jgi:uncharacterized membrane protein YgcG
MPFMRRLPALAALTAVLLVAAVSPALAQTLTERVVDESGVMSADQVAEAQDAIAELEDEANVQLWSLFVSTTDGEAVTEFADAVATENGLGGNDALLVVATEDRRDALWVGDLLDDATDDEIDRILAEQVEPRLAASDWGAAIAGAAAGLGDALDTDGGGQPDEEPEQPGTGAAPPSDGSDGPGGFGFILAIGAIGLGAWILLRWWQSGRAAEEDDRERESRLRGLAQRANALLIQTDELLRHNGQELGFVEAEFGADAAEPFRAALGSARAELQAAFKLRQQLDDGTPEAPEERERLLAEIVSRCERAHELVEAQTERFRELRDLERRAPEVLAEQQARVADAEQRLPAADATVETLRAEATGSTKAVHGNVAEARKRIELAGRAATDGLAALERGDRGAAARAAKASQDALAQAGTLLAAIDHEAAALEEARTQLPAAVERARTDLQLAGTAVTGAIESGQEDELATAKAKLEAADAAASGSPLDLVLAYRLAREAESAAEAVVAAVRKGEERQARELAAVDAAIRAGELAADRAEEFIATRRHGIGRRARTALSEADASLSQARALRDTDPQAALAQARRGNQLADAAYERARQDFGATVQDGQGGTIVIGGQPFPMGRGANWGSDVGGAIIGGIIGSILSGGGRRGGGGFGGFGGGGGFGGFGGGGGLGGGGRSFGGGFGGGGGGRSRGGGW